MSSTLSETRLSIQEWRSLPKDNFHALVKLWCSKTGNVETVRDGDSLLRLPARLPYRWESGARTHVLVATSFLDLARTMPVRPRMRREGTFTRHAAVLREAASPHCCNCEGTGNQLFQGVWITCRCATGR